MKINYLYSYILYIISPFYIFYVLINFNQRIITLQYYDGFCHKSTWISHRYTCVPPSYWTPFPPPSSHYPSGLSQSTDFGYPASWVNLALVICFIYSNVRVSMRFLQIIPPSPSPTEFKNLFFISVSPLQPCLSQQQRSSLNFLPQFGRLLTDRGSNSGVLPTIMINQVK